MKKTIWAIAALIIMAGAITFVAACTKESSPADTIAAKSQSYTVGFRGLDYAEAELVFDKGVFLATLEKILQNKTAESGQDFLSEDVKIYFENGGTDEEVAILQISLFETIEELGHNLFFVLQKEQHPQGSTYKLNSGEISSTCISSNCLVACNGIYDETIGQVNGCTCSKPDPEALMQCKYLVTQKLVQDAVYMAFGAMLK